MFKLGIVGRLLTLFTPHYELDQDGRTVIKFCRHFEDNHNKASYDLELKCEEKRGVSDNYKSFVLGILKKGITGESIEGARLLLVINSAVVDKLKLR